ncbi:MAG: N-acetylmuramoyl-L-alanine amidase [Candidatus Obscuribacter sp.]|nr:N-acetylmuramoyl-L-alanine amidase [Candidatus Obscuribacter sp.]
MLSALALIFASLAACLLVPALTGKPAALGATKSASKDKVANKPDQTPELLPLAGTTVLVDPGHGGTDPGAISGGVSEKISSSMSRSNWLEKLEELGADVGMTRADDNTFITLPGRLDESNKSVQISLSVCMVTGQKPDISGIGTWLL